MNRDRSDLWALVRITVFGIILAVMMSILFGLLLQTTSLGSIGIWIAIGLALLCSISILGFLLFAGPYGLLLPVGPYEGILLLNYLTKERFVLLKGLRPKLPWEIPMFCFSLLVQQVTSGDPDIVEEQAELYPTADGNVVKVFWSFPFRVDDRTQESLQNYARNEIGIVPNMAKQYMGGWIGAKLIAPGEKADELIGKRTELNAELEMAFNGGDQKLTDFLKEYGLIHQTPKISNIQYDDQSQKLRNIKYAGDRLLEFIGIATKEPYNLSSGEAREFFMAEDDVAQVRIYRFEGDVDIRGLEELKTMILGGGGGQSKRILRKGGLSKGN